jgi:hypothetical protein
MNLPSVVAKQQQVNATIAQVINQLAPHVVHIRYDIGRDWSGDWAIFFRVLLSDEASTGNNLRTVTTQVERMMSERLDFEGMGVISYFNFRSQSEQAAMREPAWM